MNRPPLEVNVYLQNNDQMRMLEALLEDSRQQKVFWRERCKRLEIDLGREQVVNLEMIDLLKSYGFRYRPGLDISAWHLEGGGNRRKGT